MPRAKIFRPFRAGTWWRVRLVFFLGMRVDKRMWIDYQYMQCKNSYALKAQNIIARGNALGGVGGAGYGGAGDE